MAKTNGKTKVIGLIVTLLLVFASVVGSFVTLQARTKEVEKDVKELETEGCKPSEVNEKAIIEIRMDMRYIKAGIDRIEKKLPD